MAVSKFTDALIYLGTKGLHGKSNQVAIQQSVNLIDATTFGQTTKINLAGQKSWSISASGFWDVGTDVATTGVSFVESDASGSLFSRIGAANSVISIAPANADLGTVFFGKEVNGSYQTFGNLGDAIPFSIDGESASPLCRGVMGFAPSSRSGASGNGTAIQLGALTSGQKLMAALHVVQFNGTTMTMKVQSDTVGFGSPTDVITFTAATGLTSEWIEVSGPITDDYFRGSFTFTGTTFTAILSFGIYTP
jgi:hypothetical protein